MPQYGFYIDIGRCTGCNGCVIACKQFHDIQPGPAKPRRVYQWEKGAFPDLDVRVLSVSCMHCENPLCLDACDHKAIRKEEKYGAVLVDSEKCKGDRKCYEACPYGAPQFLSDDPKEKMLKCDMCYDRLEAGESPLCVLSCSLRALDFGPLDDLKAKYGATDGIIPVGRPPCQDSCPAGVNAQEYINHMADENYDAALSSYYQVTPFAGSLGRVCTHACEIDCFRGRFDDAVSIRELKRYMAEHASADKASLLPTPAADNGKKIAVVGAGPSGLSCAYQLRLRGYQVEVFERQAQPGGMLRYGIPAYRLPKDVVSKEVELVSGLGVKIHCSCQIDNLETLLKDGFDAVYVATGCSEGLHLDVPGENLPRVHSAIAFMLALNSGEKPSLGRRVAVIGGGNVAMDAARSALRLGAQRVDVISLEKLDYKSSDRMPAQEEEVREAQEEGAVFHPSHGVSKFEVTESGLKVHCNDCVSLRDENGRFSPKYRDCVPPYVLEVDDVLVAIGQKSAEAAFPTGLPKERNGPAMAEYYLTKNPKIFAGGDLSTGPSDIVSAVAAGNEAAESIDRFCKGEALSTERRVIPKSNRPRVEKKSYPVASAPAAERLCGFQESSRTYGAELAAEQAQRCLRCGSLQPSAVIRREQPKRNIIPWDKHEALRLWSKRHPESGEILPDVIDDINAVLAEPAEDTFFRSKLVLKPKTSEERLLYTMDDE